MLTQIMANSDIAGGHAKDTLGEHGGMGIQARRTGADMDMILPQVHMLVAKVAYAKGRKLVTDSFVDMMKSGISQIHDEDDLQIFANFLESFMGFYKVYGPK